jgi:hypothetical protein
MATQVKPTPTIKKPTPIAAKATTTAKTAIKQEATKGYFAFTKQNYILMIVGILVIISGYYLMAGGKSPDPNVFNPDLFSSKRIIIAPAIVLFGYLIEAFAILYVPKGE